MTSQNRQMLPFPFFSLFHINFWSLTQNLLLLQILFFYSFYISFICCSLLYLYFFVAADIHCIQTIHFFCTIVVASIWIPLNIHRYFQIQCFTSFYFTFFFLFKGYMYTIFSNLYLLWKSPRGWNCRQNSVWW